MREIVLDTETTGLDALHGDRIVEIGCVEIWNHGATGRTFHKYLNPQRPMSADSIRITGLSDAFLAGQPLIFDVVDEFLDFIGEDPLVIHNAAFDVGFLNAELQRCAKPLIGNGRVVDTLAAAKKRFPGAQASLDALCRRFGVDNSGREKHGALLDAELLAEVYLELNGGRQPDLMLAAMAAPTNRSANAQSSTTPMAPRPARRSLLTEDEAAAHEAFIQDLGEDALWIARPDPARRAS
ncbi:MAG: DNA polymerase III subunit epsilon [Pseudomonadota bacterium]